MEEPLTEVTPINLEIKVSIYIYTLNIKSVNHNNLFVYSSYVAYIRPTLDGSF